jgi:hypothetical protein
VGCLSLRGDALSLGFDLILGDGARLVVTVAVVGCDCGFILYEELPELTDLPEEATVDAAVLESTDAIRDLFTILGVLFDSGCLGGISPAM